MIQLQFSVAPEGWVSNLVKNDSATVKILSMKPEYQGKGVTHFVDIVSNHSSADRLVREIRRSQDVTESDVASVGPNRIVGAVTSNDCMVCSLIMDSKTGYFVGPATTEEEGGQTIYKLFMSGDSMPKFLQSLHEKGITYQISEIAKITPTKALTSKQERVLKSALEMGYYEYPKRVSTEELASALGQSPSTVSEILRRAERRIISEYFEHS
jgi:predicted DNA binding protein